mgnify:CR=1 FL=1|jgi:hypothetical protein
MESLSAKIIEDKILNNYIDYSYLFIKFQSKFLSGLYSRYQNLDNGKLILHFTKETHQDILREKEYDLNFNISYEKFWDNHQKIEPRQKSLIEIAKDTILPKETTRRKVSQLIKQKVLNKKNRNIGWLPDEQYKQSYNLFINEEIYDVSQLISFICKANNLSISLSAIEKEIKEKFCFYWFHYLKTQLEYIKMWSRHRSDLELFFIGIQIVGLFITKAKEKNLSHTDIYSDPSLIKDFISASISATSISEVTGIPRATCVRKLETLVKMKMISQDKTSKRYYLIPDTFTENLVSQKITKNTVKIFSNFYFICIRAMESKI